MEQFKIPGTAVLIVKDGKIAYAKGFGVKEYGSNDRVDENTLFLIGSNTKAFTGTLLALLEYENKLKLEDRVRNYLPNFQLYDQCASEKLNLIDIVSHRMGYDTFQGDFMYWTSDLNEDQVLEKFGKLPPKFDFRAKYGYTNAGYSVAGKVIYNVTNLRWGDYLKEKILLPLRMTRTVSLSQEFAMASNVAKPHTLINGEIKVLPFDNIDNLAPCGSMGSSIMDLSKWIIIQLDSGRLDGKSVIPFKVIERTRQPQTFVRKARHPFNKSNFILYGLGWVLQDYEGREIVSHTGGVNGFLTSVTLLPKENLGVVVLTNTDQNTFYEWIKWEIIDAYLNLPYRNYLDFGYNLFNQSKTQKLNRVKNWRDSVTLNLKTPIPLNEFAGKYEHEVYGYAEIIPKENYLELKLQHHSKITGKLEYIGNNRFVCTYSDPVYGIEVFQFEIENNKVKSFDLKVDDFIDYMVYKFVKK